jgi:septum formation protein
MTSTTLIPRLVLASTSKYRKELVSRLRVPFECAAPELDETPLPHEAPIVVAQRLALAKAQAIAATLKPSLTSLNGATYIIGSDQVLDLHGEALGKPHTHANAVAMLQNMRGQTMQFHTAVAVVRRNQANQVDIAVGVDTVRVRIKALSDAQIETYLRLDTPYDCAGSCKSETLGIALCDSIDSSDPTSQIGLPLILTLKLLSQLGYEVLDYAGTADTDTHGYPPISPQK